MWHAPWVLSGSNESALAALAQCDGVTLEEAVELFAWREPTLWNRVGDECRLDPALLERVRRLASTWREPGMQVNLRRVGELSRMLAGVDTGLARGHAEELLAAAAEDRCGR